MPYELFSSYNVMQMPTWRSKLFRNLHKFSTNSMRYLRSWKCFLKNWLFYFTNSSILCCVCPFTASCFCSKYIHVLLSFCNSQSENKECTMKHNKRVVETVPLSHSVVYQRAYKEIKSTGSKSFTLVLLPMD